MLVQLPALLALVALGILPPGVMPQLAGDGIEMVLCSGDGAVTMVLDPATGELSPKQEPNSGKPGCDWAMAQALADLPAQATALPLPMFTTHRAQRDLAADLWRPAHDPRGIYARGPPTLI